MGRGHALDADAHEAHAVASGSYPPTPAATGVASTGASVSGPASPTPIGTTPVCCSIAMTFGSLRVATHAEQVAEVLGHAGGVAGEAVAGSSLSHPPAPANQRGVVKWQYVTTGVTPCSRQVPIIRR